MKVDLTGKVAVITGGSRGLGEAMAVGLAEAGATLALVARDEAKLQGVKARIEGAGGKAAYFLADVTNEADVTRIASEVQDQLGGGDILINNAGTNVRKHLVDLTVAEFQSVMDSSLTSTFLVSRAFVPGMRAKKWGRIINMTSMLSHVSLPGRTPYSSAKTALLGFTRSLALEVAARGITVNAVCPGYTETDMATQAITTIREKTGRSEAEAVAELARFSPQGRLMQPGEVAAAVAWLVLPGAEGVTGQSIVVAGGEAM